MLIAYILRLGLSCQGSDGTFQGTWNFSGQMELFIYLFDIMRMHRER